jgi:hypothetical protein
MRAVTIYFRCVLERLGASIMMGGATVRSRNIRIIKNAPMFLLTFGEFGFRNTRRIDLARAADYHPLGQGATAKVALGFGFSDLHGLK